MDAEIMFTCPLCNDEFYPEEEHLLRDHMKAVHLEQMLAYHRQPPQMKTKPRKINLCFALGCNETNENKNLSFFYLPRRPRSLVWLINAGRYDMLSTPVELYVHHKICSKHFEMSACADTLKSKVFAKALPTIFTHSLEIMKNHAKGAEVPSKGNEPHYSNSLIDQFHDTTIFERGSKTKMFSIKIVPVDEHYNHHEIKSRPATKVFKAGNKALIYKLLKGQDVYKISESIFKKKIKSNHKTCASKKANASADREVSKADQTISEFREDNYDQESYQIFSLEDIDPLLHQDNCSSVLQLTEEIVNSNKETGIPEIRIDDSVLNELTSVPDLETVGISEDVALVQESFLEHDYCCVSLCSISSLCRLCAKELQNPDEKSVVDVLQSLHPLFQKSLDLLQEFEESNCLPEKVCSPCVEKLQMCDTLFQQIAEANVKLKTYIKWTQKHADSDNISEVGNFESDEQLKEHQHTSIGPEVTTEKVALDKPPEEPSESYVCNECPESRVYKSLMDLRCHKALVHEADTNTGDSRKKGYVCKYCRRKFKCLKEFYHHPCKKQKRPNRPEHPPVQRILKTVYTRRYKRHSDGYVCCTCGHIAPSEDDIKTHWRIHIPSVAPKRRLYPKKEPIYGCHICGRRFTEEKYLTKHIEMHPNWRCKTCGKLFKSHILLQNHKRKHEPDFTRLCYLCGNMYANIFQHMKNIHFATSKPRRISICHICGKVLAHNQYLKSHIYRVHEGVNKNIPCPHCQKTYFDETALKKHIRKVHATPKHFKCDLCHMAYKTQVSLKKHIDKKHLACKMSQKQFPTNGAKNEHEVLEHNEGSGCGQSSGTEDSMQECKELEENGYSLEDLQAISGSIQVILTAGGELVLDPFSLKL